MCQTVCLVVFLNNVSTWEILGPQLCPIPRTSTSLHSSSLISSLVPEISSSQLCGPGQLGRHYTCYVRRLSDTHSWASMSSDTSEPLGLGEVFDKHIRPKYSHSCSISIHKYVSVFIVNRLILLIFKYSTIQPNSFLLRICISALSLQYMVNNLKEG